MYERYKRYSYMSSHSVLQQLVSYMLPPTILDYFDVVLVEERAIEEKDRKGLERGEVVIHLEEHNEFRTPEEGHTYRPNGFYAESKIKDFPLRDRRVTLILHRRRWIDEQTGKSVGNKYNIVTEGTRHTVEFAAFLKETFGYVPDSCFVA